jgi:hypothetical protein
MDQLLWQPHRVLAAPLCLVVLLVGAARGQTQNQTQNQTPRFRLGGLVQYENFSFFQDRDADLINFRNELKFLPDLEVRFSDKLRGALAVEFRKDFSDSSRSRVFLDKAYLDVYLPSWDFRLGRQIISWGRTDKIKPTDSFKRHDYTDFLDDDEEPIYAAKANYYIKDWTLEWVWAPIFEPDIFRLDPRNRWAALPRRADVPGVGTFDLSYQVNTSARPAKNLKSSQAGFRLTQQHGGLDWSASYYYGYDRIPTFVSDRVVAADLATGSATIELTPVHKRIQVVGFDWATVVGGFGLRGETSYTLTADRSGRDPLIDDPYFRFVGGLDRTFSRIISSHDLYLNLQYVLDTEVPRHGVKNQDGVNVRLRHFYEQGLTAHLEYKFSEFKKVVARSFVNLEQGDFLIQTEFNWQPKDAWTWTIGGDFMDGKTGSFFGLYSRNDRLRTSVKFNF